MQIFTYILGELQTNSYLIEANGEGIIIDPADDANIFLEELSRKRIRLAGIILTHGHFDHMMAAGEIQLSVNVPMYIHKDDQFLIDRAEETAQHFLGRNEVILPPQAIHYMHEGKNKIRNFILNVLYTPGHTPGSICLYFPNENVIFTGDTLFAGAIGRTDFAYGNKENLMKSLKKILSLPDGTVIYAGHGEPTFVMEEKKNVE